MSELNIHVNVHYLTRVEGHGNLVIDVEKGTVERCEWQVVEAPRFFEAMVVGREYHELSYITSRICGICSVGHTLASLKASEAALGIEISPQTRLLRRILVQGENIQSHVLHAYFLAAPDFLGVKSVVPLASSHPDVVKRALRMKKLANDLCDVFGGRTVHPNATTVGGFTKFPTEAEVVAIRQRFIDAKEDLVETMKLFQTLTLPDFERETEYIGLTSDEEYAIYDGDVASTDTGRHPVTDYLKLTNEWVHPRSTAKYARANRDSFFVGALARFNLNHAQLTPFAQEVAEALGLKPICYNPYMNTVAQVVETVHGVDEVIRLTTELLEQGIRREDPIVKIQAGRGVGAVDVPRGILYHDYTYDESGVCQHANCIIPTNQNHANIQLDLEKLVPLIMKKPEKEIELLCEMLVRAYDPCISCSTHLLNVEFRRG